MESVLRGRRDDGAKLLVVYITGGYEGWEAAVETAAAAEQMLSKSGYHFLTQ